MHVPFCGAIKNTRQIGTKNTDNIVSPFFLWLRINFILIYRNYFPIFCIRNDFSLRARINKIPFVAYLSNFPRATVAHPVSSIFVRLQSDKRIKSGHICLIFIADYVLMHVE